MKVIIKRPCDQFGEETTIPNTLRALQETVGGYIETITLPEHNLVLICNEEGKLRDMPYNFTLRRIHGIINPIFGTVIACGVDGEEFAGIPIDFNEWKALLCEWGN